MNIKNSIALAHLLCRQVQDPTRVVDATLGNGKDSLFLSRLVGNNGQVFSFDIQQRAIDQAKELFEKEEVHNVSIIHDSHASMKEYCQGPMDIILFNLGYLPRGDKSITTKSSSTIEAIKQGLDLIRRGGAMVIVAYHGHLEGQEELADVRNFLSELPQEEFSVLESSFINQVNRPPVVFHIERK